MEEAAITLKNVTVQLGGKTVLEDITLTIPRGEFWGVIGPNGGGKTTLLRTIIGTIKPQTGSVKVLGLPPKEAVRNGWVGYLPQRIKGMIPFSALDFVSLVGKREEAERTLEMVKMSHKAHEPFEKLSGGEKQRILIASVLSRNPKVLLLDEPSTGVDSVAQDTFYNILKELKDRGITIVMVSHDVGVIAQFVDNIACLNKRLKHSGDPRKALDCRLLEELYGHSVNVFVHHPECLGCHFYRR